MDSPSEEEQEEKATEIPALVMVDDSTGNKYMRLVHQKGIGTGKQMMWLVRDIHAELKAWGHPGGAGNEIIMKSDGESPFVALREAIAKVHGGRVTPEQPPKGEHPANGVAEEAGRTVRDMARVLKLQLEKQIQIHQTQKDMQIIICT